MAKAPVRELNKTPPASERPPGKPPSPRQIAEKEADKAAVADAPLVDPAQPDDFPEREACDPPQTPKPLEVVEEVEPPRTSPVATKVEAPAARVTRDKAGKIKSQAKGRGAPRAEPTPKVNEAPPPAGDNGLVAQEALASFIERIERLESEKQGIADDIRDVYTEAKLQGFNSGIMRECVKIRKLEPDKREEKYNLLALYTKALGIDLGFDLI